MSGVVSYRLLWVAAILATITALREPKADEGSLAQDAVTVEQIVAHGRPANLFALAYGATDDQCEAILTEFEKPFDPKGKALDYFEILSHSSDQAHWTPLRRSTGFLAGLAEIAQVDLFNNGSNRPVFRAHSMSAGRDSTVLAADGPFDPSSNLKDPSQSAAWRALAAGELDDRLVVPRTKDRERFSRILEGLGLTKLGSGYPRHEIFSVQGRTYVVEGNAYEFAPDDFLFVFSGRPDGSFSLDCVLDPQVHIPTNPRDIYKE
ncbi:hypothetical protein [Dongia deserti]|uniref:hypothetical protein n=1 Tax=Dongia deserti TaxID=2268030 RepID=UPI000E6563E3|nr:hypothetical protein [Dongia deserti]